MIGGVLVIDKPPGLTSHDVVAAARRWVGERRIGHCGTLDPMATGVLVLAIGAATRLVQFLSATTKEYDAVIRFGLTTDTRDVTGAVGSRSSERPTREALEAALDRFRGSFDQVPPRHSAKKIQGTRSYELARKDFAAAPVPAAVRVSCEDLRVTTFDGDSATLSMRVSAGFYVRSLAHDLGNALGMGAVLEQLRRTRAGQFHLADALPFGRLVAEPAGGIEPIPLEALLPDIPAVMLSEVEAGRVKHGMHVRRDPRTVSAPLIRLFDPGGRLVALARPDALPGLLHPFAVLG